MLGIIVVAYNMIIANGAHGEEVTGHNIVNAGALQRRKRLFLGTVILSTFFLTTSGPLSFGHHMLQTSPHIYISGELSLAQISMRCIAMGKTSAVTEAA